MKKVVAISTLFAMLLSLTIGFAEPMKYEDYSQYPLAENDVTITVLSSTHPTYGREADDTWFWPWIESITGINFEVEKISEDALDTRRNLLMASADLPDLLMGMYMTTSDLVRYGQGDGLFLDLTPYINEDVMPNLSELIEYNPAALGLCRTPDGKIYTLPYINLIMPGQSGLFFIDQEKLDEAGLEVPQTLDEFVDMLYAFKEHDPSVIPLGGGSVDDGVRNPIGYLINAMGYLTDMASDGTEIAIRNGEAVIPAADPTFVEVLKLMNQFYNDDIISKDFFSISLTAINGQMAEGKLGTFRSYPYMVTPEYEDFNKWVSAMPLTSEWNDTKQWLAANAISIGNIQVSAETKHAELIMRYLDFFYSPMGIEYAWIGPVATTGYGMGIVEGWDMNPETGEYYWYDVISGKCENGADYACGWTSGLSDAIGNQGIWPSRPELTHVDQRRMVVAGHEPIQTSWDMQSGDNNYRASMEKNITPYEVPGFPAITYLTEEETLELNDLESVLVPYMQTELARFITGARSLDEYDEYLAELDNMNIGRLLEIYQSIWATYKGE